MSLLLVTKENYESEVLNSAVPVLLDFWAVWCGPCQKLTPTIEEIARERSDIKVCKVDVDTQQQLAISFGVMSIPTLIVMKDGKEYARSVGLKAKDKILALLP